MTWGGKRDNAGRKINPLRTSKLAEMLISRQKQQYGDTAAPTPLEFVLAEMWNMNNPREVRRSMAIAALPFCSPKLQSVNIQSEEDNKLVIQLVDFKTSTVKNGELLSQAAVITVPHKPDITHAILADDEEDEDR